MVFRPPMCGGLACAAAAALDPSAPLAAAAARLRGDRVRVFPVPKTLLYLLSLGTTLSAKALGDDPMLTPGKVRELTFEDWSCDSSAFRARTGWTPQISLDAGLRSLYP